MMQPETGLLHASQDRHIRASRQRGFKGKVGAGFGEFRDSFQHRAPGTQKAALGSNGERPRAIRPALMKLRQLV